MGDYCPLKPSQVFLREATGLVRGFSWFDAFMISSAGIGYGIFGFASTINYVTTANPGSDPLLSGALGWLLSIPPALLYGLLASVFSRSGADYVWTSRLVGSAVGFVGSWALMIMLCISLGMTGALVFSTSMLTDTVTAFAGFLGRPDLLSLSTTLSQPPWLFVTGIMLLVVTGLVAGLGCRVVSRAMVIMTGLIFITSIVSFYVLATSTHADFVNALSGYAGTSISYQGVIKDAQASGWSLVPITWSATIPSIPLGYVIYLGFCNSALAAGEVRQAKRSMPLAVIGSLVPAVIINVVGTYLCVRAFGIQFLYAAVNDPKWPLPAAPWATLFVSMLAKDVVTLSLIQVGWLAWAFWWSVSLYIMIIRYIFAFSFDRVLPTMFADVSSRFHMPVKAMVVSIILSTIAFPIGFYVTYIGANLNTVAISSILYILGAITAIILPIKRKSLAEELPGKWRIPFISIVGAINLVLSAYILFLSVTVPAVGPSTPVSAAELAAIYGSGILLFIVRYRYLKKKGLDLRLVFNEIPPE